MHSESTAGQVAGPTGNSSNDLELVCYGSGYAWLRPDVPQEPRRYVLPSRYVLTELGRRALLLAWLLEPGPTVAEVEAQARGGVAA